jgi:hypothetical protein
VIFTVDEPTIAGRPVERDAPGELLPWPMPDNIGYSSHVLSHCSAPRICFEAFPIKASGHPPGIVVECSWHCLFGSTTASEREDGFLPLHFAYSALACFRMGCRSRRLSRE